MDDASAMMYRRNGITVKITVDEGEPDGHSRCRIPGRPSNRNSRLVFYPDECAQLILPVTDPGDAEIINRDGIGLWRTGHDVRTGAAVNLGIPFGLAARQLVMYLCTESRRSGRTMVVRSHEALAFLAMLGTTPREPNEVALWEDQLERVFAVTWMMANTPRGTNPTNMFLGEYRKHGLRHLSPETECGPTITLDSRFASTALDWIALDADSVRRFSRHSCTALDAYIWLCAVARGLNEAAEYTWDDLHQRFGADVSPTAFQEEFGDLVGQAADACETVAVRTNAAGLEIRTLVEPASMLFDMHRSTAAD